MINLKKNILAFIFILLISSINAQEYSSLVDTKIGSKGDGLACGYNFIGATYPFGMVQFTPTFFLSTQGICNYSTQWCGMFKSWKFSDFTA